MAFIILSAQTCWYIAGIIEWVMAFLGTGYMGLFAGFFVGYVYIYISNSSISPVVCPFSKLDLFADSKSFFLCD